MRLENVGRGNATDKRYEYRARDLNNLNKADARAMLEAVWNLQALKTGWTTTVLERR